MKMLSIKSNLNCACVLMLVGCSGGGSETPKPSSDPIPGNPSIQFSVTDVSTKGGGNGAIQATITGGTSPYVYAWSTGASTKDLGNLRSGAYSLTVTDANHRSATKKVAVVDPSQAKDLDANIYETVVLGTQTWLASNFRCTQTPAGGPIEVGSDVQGGSTAPRVYSFVQAGGAGLEANPVLYNWPGAQAACLSGWHIPTEQEWLALLAYLAVDGQGGAGTNTAAKTRGSASPSGFNGLYSGIWDAGTFFDKGAYAAFWTATEYPNDSRDMWEFKLDSQAWSKIAFDKRCAFSLRLIKN